MTTTEFVDIILSDVRFINTLGLSAEIVEKKIGEFKNVRYNESLLYFI